jgi:ADP-ribose pyrophosphatase
MNDNTLIHSGRLISLYREKVELREGGHTHFDIVKHPGGAVIAAINDHNEICLLRQWRHAVNKTIWEVPAGCLESGESPLITAQRELEEEAGVCASKWQALGTIISTPGFCDEVLHLYKASQLSGGVSNLDSAEQLVVEWVSLPRAIRMAASGEIEDAKTLAIMLRLQSLDPSS